MNRNEIAREVSLVMETGTVRLSVFKQYSNVIILRCGETKKLYRIEVRNNPS